jgi:TolB protein
MRWIVRSAAGLRSGMGILPSALFVALSIASAACNGPSTVVADVSPSEGSGSPQISPPPAGWRHDIYLIDPYTGEAKVLLHEWGNQTNAEFSPDGTRLVYQNNFGGNNFGGEVSQIFVLEPDGTRRQLTNLKHGAHDPTWSPDGSQIAFASRSWKCSDADIFVMNSDGSGVRRLIGTERNDSHPDWSPDGARVVFHGGFETNSIPSGLVWVASVRTGTLTRVTWKNSPYADVDPAWSPNGRWVAYSGFTRSTLNGTTPYAKLWLSRLGVRHKRVIVSRVYDHWMQNPSWSPNGHSIVFEDNLWRGAGGSVRVIDLRTGSIRTILEDARNAGPSWSPRGILVSLSMPVR